MQLMTLIELHKLGQKAIEYLQKMLDSPGRLIASDRSAFAKDFFEPLVHYIRWRDSLVNKVANIQREADQNDPSATAIIFQLQVDLLLLVAVIEVAQRTYVDPGPHFSGALLKKAADMAAEIAESIIQSREALGLAKD